MQHARAMYKSILISVVLGLCACGQQPRPLQTPVAGGGAQTHTAVSPNKGQIIQPQVKPGKDADGSALLITFHGCADLLLTDARGRRLGYDPAAKKSYMDVPGGAYDEGDVLGDDEEDDAKPQKQPENKAAKQPDCVADKSMQVPQPAPGAYVLKIGNNQANAFKLEITSYGPDAKANGHYVLSQPAGFNPSPSYRFELPSPGAELEVKAAAK